MATVQDVFDATMALMDELNDNGEAVSSDTTEYLNRTLPIMNLMIGECYPYSDLRDSGSVLSTWKVVEEMDDELKSHKIDNTLALTIMPYGLAANLLVDENPSAASFYQARYEELLRQKSLKMQADVGIIEDLYGVYGGYNNGAIWG